MRTWSGLSAANAAAALSGTFVVDGSPTQTAMVESSGGQSQLAQVATATVVALVLLFLTRPLQYLPRCALDAIVFFIAIRLIDLRGLRDIRRESPQEYWLAVITAAVVVLVGVEQGILLAMVLSLLRVVRHSYRPHTGVLVPRRRRNLGLGSGGSRSHDRAGVGALSLRSGALLRQCRPFLRRDTGLVGPSPSPVRWLVVDAEAITNIDYTAARMVRQLHQELARCGVELAFARLPASLKADLQRHRLTEVIGPTLVFDRLHDALHAYEHISKTGRAGKALQ